MDLTKEYMKKQGTLGYLHEHEMKFFGESVVLSYGEEGAEPKYYITNRLTAERMLGHWGETGDFIMEDYDFASRRTYRDVVHPDHVVMMKVEKRYTREHYPPGE